MLVGVSGGVTFDSVAIISSSRRSGAEAAPPRLTLRVSRSPSPSCAGFYAIPAVTRLRAAGCGLIDAKRTIEAVMTISPSTTTIEVERPPTDNLIAALWRPARGVRGRAFAVRAVIRPCVLQQ